MDCNRFFHCVKACFFFSFLEDRVIKSFFVPTNNFRPLVFFFIAKIFVAIGLQILGSIESHC